MTPPEPDGLSPRQRAEAFGSAASETAGRAMDTGIADATPLEVQLGIRAANALRQSRDAIDIAAQKVRDTSGELAHRTADATGRMVASQRPAEIDPLTRGRIEASREAERHARERAEKRDDRDRSRRDERSR